MGLGRLNPGCGCTCTPAACTTIAPYIISGPTCLYSTPDPSANSTGVSPYWVVGNANYRTYGTTYSIYLNGVLQGAANQPWNLGSFAILPVCPKHSGHPFNSSTQTHSYVICNADCCLTLSCSYSLPPFSLLVPTPMPCQYIPCVTGSCVTPSSFVITSYTPPARTVTIAGYTGALATFNGDYTASSEKSASVSSGGYSGTAIMSVYVGCDGARGYVSSSYTNGGYTCAHVLRSQQLYQFSSGSSYKINRLSCLTTCSDWCGPYETTQCRSISLSVENNVQTGGGPTPGGGPACPTETAWQGTITVS
jgi:hypothetical protein